MEGIAREMGLGLGTIKTYARRVYTKLGVSTQLELVLTVVAAQRRLGRP
jgi:DNA-binding NarL/FixJ family response regulator